MQSVICTSMLCCNFDWCQLCVNCFCFTCWYLLVKKQICMCRQSAVPGDCGATTVTRI